MASALEEALVWHSIIRAALPIDICLDPAPKIEGALFISIILVRSSPHFLSAIHERRLTEFSKAIRKNLSGFVGS